MQSEANQQPAASQRTVLPVHHCLHQQIPIQSRHLKRCEAQVAFQSWSRYQLTSSWLRLLGLGLNSQSNHENLYHDSPIHSEVCRRNDRFLGEEQENRQEHPAFLCMSLGRCWAWGWCLFVHGNEDGYTSLESGFLTAHLWLSILA